MGVNNRQAMPERVDCVAQQAAQFNATLSLGQFDRLEIEFPEGRAVAQAREDRLVYVRTATAAPKGAAA